MMDASGWNPYRLDGPLGTADPIALHISGGRSSGYMLWHILEAFDGTLPTNIHPLFANTGRERDETLDFVADMTRHWSVPITWIERDWNEPAGYREVGHNSATRRGQWGPFDAVIERRGFLPNKATRFCTTELKVRAASKWMVAHGYERWASILGYRADERHRLIGAQKQDETGKNRWYTLAPMVDAGVTKRHVAAFWKRQPFDLRLPNIKGKTPDGNCDGCFLKSEAYLAGLCRREPEHFSWWPAWEARGLGKTQLTGTFRHPDKQGMTHTQIADFIARQGDMIGDLSDEPDGTDCFCTD